jgi:flagellar hook-length control protein FliK
MITTPPGPPGPLAPLAPPAPPVASATAGSPPNTTDAEAERFQRLLQQADPRRANADKAAQARAGHKAGPTPGSDKVATTATPPAEGTPTDGPAPTSATAAEPGEATAGTDAAAMLAALQSLHVPTPQPTAPPAGEKADDARSPAVRGRGPQAGAAADASAPKDAGAAPGFADALQAQAAAEAAPQATEAPLRAMETTPPLPPALAAPPATIMSASAPAEARIAASPGSPDFASQLGAQLSTFVREGVQHARLELHPTELGPVTVQIQLDGSQAQVKLSAELGDTRQALEQALPQLASSLREAGLTLTGGGVFEQPRQAPQPNGTRDTRRNPPIEEDDVKSVSAVPAARRRGVVDLVA